MGRVDPNISKCPDGILRSRDGTSDCARSWPGRARGTMRRPPDGPPEPG